MALLDMARLSGVYLEVAHMNYHHRPTADRDEKLVRSYCRKYSIKFHRCDFDENRYPGNFQSAARNARYDFFKKTVDKNKLEIVLIAHQKDDLIETYLMQKEKKLETAYYGIRKENVINGVRVLRPLLSYEKNDLIRYCDDNKIVYGIDESNLTDDYERNRIRHNKVDKMDHKQKQLMIQKINKENKIRKTHLAKAKEKLNKEEYSVSSFLKIPYLKEYLRTIFVHRSKKTIEEYLRQLRDGEKCNFETDDYCLIKEYGKIFFFKKPENYSYTFKNLDEMKNKKYQYFRIAKKGSNFEGVTLKEDDFPVVIRNVIEGDKIVMRYGTKKLNRFFIDNKIPMKERLSWPVLINRTGSAILVPGIGCDKYHYSDNHNMFVIKL